MRNRLIEAVEQSRQRKDTLKFEIGDTVSVGVRIVEGNKERVQPFIGVVVGRRGRGLNETFTVRRIVNNEGVERIFPTQSPRIAGVEVIRHGKVRRGKLFYLRNRVGKARKLRERVSTGGDDSAAPAPAGKTAKSAAREAEMVVTA
ncbi:MAG: 50S ribosomal protein L19 [Planctomycetota bacterium]|nr:MAG: 50S ribosomal protein L19 [Planctomycetota bacterium]